MTTPITDAQASEALRRELQLAVPGATVEALDAAVGSPSPTSASADERLAAELRLAVPGATQAAIEATIARMTPSVDTTRRLMAEARARPRIEWTAADQAAYVERVRQASLSADAPRPAASAPPTARAAAERRAVPTGRSETRAIREVGR